MWIAPASLQSEASSIKRESAQSDTVQTIHRLRGIIWPASDDAEGDVAAAPAVPLPEIARRFWPDAKPYWPWLVPTPFFVALGPTLETGTIWLYGISARFRASPSPISC